MDRTEFMKVLIADDHPRMREHLAEMMEPLGAVVVQAADGVEAVDVFRRVGPDWTCLDIEMPRMGGSRRRWPFGGYRSRRGSRLCRRTIRRCSARQRRGSGRMCSCPSPSCTGWWSVCDRRNPLSEKEDYEGTELTVRPGHERPGKQRERGRAWPRAPWLDGRDAAGVDDVPGRRTGVGA